ncbi:uncharacterized protein LOC143558681 [Bidens hawaiensis]|uniref:uncharacterized protein LOC143558681 n=1 Tax=Bidens hawaiensis TaxID=980011 RepID=UPI0040492075
MKVDFKTRDELVKEIMLYFEPGNSFMDPDAIRQRHDMLHVDWWKTFGWKCPNLVAFATNILSQTCCLVQHKRDTNRWTDGTEINADVENQNQDQSDIEIATLDMRCLEIHKSSIQAKGA